MWSWHSFSLHQFLRKRWNVMQTLMPMIAWTTDGIHVYTIGVNDQGLNKQPWGDKHCTQAITLWEGAIGTFSSLICNMCEYIKRVGQLSYVYQEGMYVVTYHCATVCIWNMSVHNAHCQIAHLHSTVTAGLRAHYVVHLEKCQCRRILFHNAMCLHSLSKACM